MSGQAVGAQEGSFGRTILVGRGSALPGRHHPAGVGAGQSGLVDEETAADRGEVRRAGRREAMHEWTDQDWAFSTSQGVPM